MQLFKVNKSPAHDKKHELLHLQYAKTHITKVTLILMTVTAEKYYNFQYSTNTVIKTVNNKV